MRLTLVALKEYAPKFRDDAHGGINRTPVGQSLVLPARVEAVFVLLTRRLLRKAGAAAILRLEPDTVEPPAIQGIPPSAQMLTVANHAAGA